MLLVYSVVLLAVLPANVTAIFLRLPSHAAGCTMTKTY